MKLQQVSMLEATSWWEDAPHSLKAMLNRAAQACWSVGDVEALIKHIDENTLTDERIMKEYECGRGVGREEARNQAVSIVRGIAAVYFLNRENEQASRWRDLGDRLAKEIAVK